MNEQDVNPRYRRLKRTAVGGVLGLVVLAPTASGASQDPVRPALGDRDSVQLPIPESSLQLEVEQKEQDEQIQMIKGFAAHSVEEVTGAVDSAQNEHKSKNTYKYEEMNDMYRQGGVSYNPDEGVIIVNTSLFRDEYTRAYDSNGVLKSVSNEPQELVGYTAVLQLEDDNEIIAGGIRTPSALDLESALENDETYQVLKIHASLRDGLYAPVKQVMVDLTPNGSSFDRITIDGNAVSSETALEVAYEALQITVQRPL
jgi:hypothetical protein